MMSPLWNRLRPAALAGIGIAVVSLAALSASAETSLVIRDFVVSRDIHQREPMDATDFFQAGNGKAVAFARIWNGGQPARISFQWRHGGKIRATVPVTVGVSPAWRTWSKISLRPGAWRVALVDTDGTVLAERAFRVGPNPDIPVAAKPNTTQGAQETSEVIIEGIVPAQIPVSADYPAR